MSVLLVALLANAAEQPRNPAAPAAAADLNSIVAQLEQVQEQASARTHPYSAVRDYRLYSSDAANATAQVMARVDFLPPDQKTYEILQAQGSGRGESVVRRVLDSETHLTKSGTSEISRRNYSFRLAGREGRDGHDCYVLALDPLRKDAGLIYGKAWVDAQTYRIRRVEGDLARTPSWWIKRTHIARTYDDRSGLWVPVATEAVADVRFSGRHTLSEHQVSLSAGEVVAMNRAPAPTPVAVRRPGAARSTPVMGAVTRYR